MEKAVAVCGQEALDLLNCVAESPYDQDKCLRLLQALRDCAVKQVNQTNKHRFDFAPFVRSFLFPRCCWRLEFGFSSLLLSRLF
ncbi:unnamed protein product [Linum trigynum]|uniref:Uncharacterized protein n=1 Tax=Linum trigynum TaxID=586398 RepID=A0AAV2DI29_9ROSI